MCPGQMPTLAPRPLPTLAMKPALPSSWSLETWAAGPGHPGVHVEIPPAEVSLGFQEVFLGRGSGNPQPLSSPGVLVRAHVFCRGDAAHTCRLRAADSLPLTVSPEQLVSLRPLLFRFPRHKTCPANSADVRRAPLAASRLPLKAMGEERRWDCKTATGSPRSTLQFSCSSCLHPRA